MNDKQVASQSMPRFIAIDGLRAWMAWVVVAGHIVQQGLPAGWSSFLTRLDIGGEAVHVFIIISGFVITHLLIERPGGYFAYIVPRFMRLFPAFFVCCLIGGAAYLVAGKWAGPTWFLQVHASGYAAITQNFYGHVIPHLFMFHGLVPNTVLPMSEYAFLPPGWSVSLEWQFYLVAPMVVWLCRDTGRATILVIAVIALGLFYHHELKPLWDRPSMLAGTAKFFIIGIGCRFAAPSLAGSVKFAAAFGIGLGFTALWMGSTAIAAWLLVYSFLLKTEDEPSGIEAIYRGALRQLLESKIVQGLAERSYSTYLLHWPIMMIVGTIATRAGVPLGPKLALVMLLTFPITLLLQEPLYRFLEVPGRDLGRRWSRALGAKRVTEVPVESLSTPR